MARTPRPASHAFLFDPLQSASAFNQPLSFDTSSVTDMKSMFSCSFVRTTRAQPPAHYLCPAIASHVLLLPAARPSPRFVALLSTRQCGGFSFSPPASSFNQPVNFDTSSVTNMYGMFYVRSPRVPCPNPSSQVSACAPLAAPLRHVLASAPSGPHLAPHRTCPPYDSAGGGKVQPAADLRHV